MTHQGTISRSSSVYNDALDTPESTNEATSHTLRTPHNRSYPTFASLPDAYPIEQDSRGGGGVDGGEFLEQGIGGEGEEDANNYRGLTRLDSSTAGYGVGSDGNGTINAMDVDDLMQVDDDEEMSSSAHATSTNSTNNCRRSSSAGAISRNSIIPSSSINQSSGQPGSGSGPSSGSGSGSGAGPLTTPKSSVPMVDEKAQSELRRKILEIQRDPNIDFGAKAGMIQKLMSSKWNAQRVYDQKGDSIDATEDDLKTTFYNAEQGQLGCKHYRRGCKLKASCCGKWFNCRFCHDDVCDHNIVSARRSNRPPKTATPVTYDSRLITVMFANCGMTTLQSRSITVTIVGSAELDEDLDRTTFTALGNMSGYYAKIDSLLAEQTMPPEYANIFSIVLCNDCEVKSEAPYHFLYHRCDKCKGYNTKVLETFKRVSNGQVQQVEVSAAVAEASNSGYSNSGGESSRTVGSSLSSVPRSPLMDQNASGDMTIAGISGNSAP
ncbi:hypothetical protein BGZ93_003879 [Podila epicladia]|nr:hypothetical protein BGZ93_003879 [Podila epicladia]